MENVLAVEILGNKITILTIATSETAWEIVGLNNLDLPPNSINEGAIVEPKLVAEQISTFIKENKIIAKKVVALINPPYVFTKLIRLPFNLSDAQIRMNLEAEINQYQAFSQKDNIIAFKKIEEISEEGIKKSSVLFATTLRVLTDSYIKTLELAGLSLEGVDIPIFCVMRLLEGVDFQSSSLEVTLLMLIGEKYIETCIIKGNRPRFLHFVEIDMYDFEKERENFIERIVSAVKLVVNFYQARFIQGERIGRIVIHPLNAKYSQIGALLQEKLSLYPIQLSNPLSKFIIDKEKITVQDDLRFRYSTLLGAALRLEGKDQSFNLDLLGEQKAQRQHRQNQIYLLLASLAAVLAVNIISFAWIFIHINILQKRLSQFTSQLQEPTPELAQAISIKERKELLQKQIEEASLIMRKFKKPYYFTNTVKAMVLVPKDLWLTEVILEKEKKYLVLTGVSRAEKFLFEYISNLNYCGYFSSAELLSSRNENDRINFSIRCAIK
jgi:Tfp pilus assembly PilM family ATPase